MSDPQIESVGASVQALIPSCQVSPRTMPIRDFEREHPHSLHRPCGCIFRPEQAILWFDLSSDQRAVLVVARETIPITKAERNLLKAFPKAIAAFLVDPNDHAARSSARIATRFAFEDVLVARYVRGQRANSIHTTSLVIALLKDLASQEYEGHHCTSGVVFATDPNEYITRLSQDVWRLDSLKEPLTMQEGFFSSPASYRYIDGRNSFLLVDNHRNVLATVRCVTPTKFSFSDRVANRHVAALLQPQHSNIWVGYIGRNLDLNLVVKNGLHLRWLRSHWHMVDRRLLSTYLISKGVSAGCSALLIDVLMSVSELRLGALVLIPDERGHQPTSVGLIDSTGLGRAIQDSIAGKALQDLSEQNALIGLVTSDGLSTVTKDGIVLSFGRIIDLSQAPTKPEAGGGRTQAALAASSYGVVLKVSQDGPLSVYAAGRQVLRMIY